VDGELLQHDIVPHAGDRVAQVEERRVRMREARVDADEEDLFHGSDTISRAGTIKRKTGAAPGTVL